METPINDHCLEESVSLFFITPHQIFIYTNKIPSEPSFFSSWRVSAVSASSHIKDTLLKMALSIWHVGSTFLSDLLQGLNTNQITNSIWGISFKVIQTWSKDNWSIINDTVNILAVRCSYDNLIWIYLTCCLSFSDREKRFLINFSC